MSHVSKMIQGVDKEWIGMGHEIISQGLRRDPNKKGRWLWTPVEAMLLVDKLDLPGSPTLKGLMSGWFEKGHLLQFN